MHLVTPNPPPHGPHSPIPAPGPMNGRSPRPRRQGSPVRHPPEPPGKAAPEPHPWGKENASRKGPKGTPDSAAKPGRRENRTARDPQAKKIWSDRQKQNNEWQKEQPARPVSGDQHAADRSSPEKNIGEGKNARKRSGGEPQPQPDTTHQRPVEKLAERRPMLALMGRDKIVLPTVSCFLRRLRSSPQFAVT
jgi:hypothetical protein